MPVRRFVAVHLRAGGDQSVAGCVGGQDGPTGKRLAPAMGLLVDSLRRHGELAISDATAANWWPCWRPRSTADSPRTGLIGTQGSVVGQAGHLVEVIDLDEDLGGVERPDSRVRRG